MAVAETLEPRAHAVADRDALAAFLRTDRRYAAYALGDLDGPNRSRVSWGMAYDRAGHAVAPPTGVEVERIHRQLGGDAGAAGGKRDERAREDAG